MATTKRKLSIYLDEDLVAELEAGEGSVSKQIGEALQDEVGRRRRQRLLRELLDRLDAEHGPVDPALIDKYIGLLG